MPQSWSTLYSVTFTQPAIDIHAHPLLRVEMRHKLPFEGVISEAEGKALLEDAPHTLACFHATKQLAKLYRLDEDNATWEDIKSHRATLTYAELCELCIKKSGIECILMDDGLAGTESLAEEYKWHDRFTSGKTKRLVRIEVVAEVCKLGVKHYTNELLAGDISRSSMQAAEAECKAITERIRNAT